MPVGPDFRVFVLDQLAGLDPIEKRMFGGIGLFIDGLMFGIVSGSDVLYLKTDEAIAATVAAAGGVPMQYTRAGKTRDMSYSTVPADILDDPEDLRSWAENAIAAAHRAAAAKRSPTRTKKTRPEKSASSEKKSS